MVGTTDRLGWLSSTQPRRCRCTSQTIFRCDACILDITFRIEKVFGVKLGGAERERLWSRHEPADFTVGELYDCVCQKLKEAGQPIPEDGWQKMQDLLVDALGVHDDEVKPSAFLMKDLGAN